MADKQFDASKKFQRLFAEKQKIREAIRQEVLKRESNPYLNPGTLHDPAITRFHAALTYKSEHGKPTPKNVIGFCGFVVIPVIVVWVTMLQKEKKREELYRSGKVAYKDRFVNAHL